jgi:hypothetical protein
MASIISAGTTSGTALNMTGDTSGQLQLATGASATTAVTIDTSQNVGIGTTSPAAKLDVTGSTGSLKRAVLVTPSSESAAIDALRTVAIQRVSNDTQLAIGYATTPDAWVISSSYGSTGAYKPLAFATSDTERMRIDSSGNVGINNSNPAQFDTSGKVLNISGAAANTNPSVLFMAGNGGGAGYEATEVFAIAGITAATEITRNTGTGANGFRAYLKVTVTGHSGGVGNGINIKEFYWDGGTGAPVQISTYTNGSVPVISFDNTTSNVWIVKLASSNGTASFNGVMKVEWLMPIDFASSTWTIS